MPGRVRRLVSRARRARSPDRRPLSQHAEHRLRECARGPGGRRHSSRRLGRRARRLPVRPTCDREHRDGGSRLPAPRRGRGHRDRPGRADRRLGVARRRSRSAARGPALPRRNLSAGVETGRGGKDRAATSPSSTSPARPRSTTVSPSSRKVLVLPSPSMIGCVPFRVSSISEPSLPGSGRRVSRREQIAGPGDAPFTVACASCCGIVQ